MLGSMRSPYGDSELVQIMDAAFAGAAQRAGKWLACKPGCSQCCHGAFAINALDAARLRAGMEILRTDLPFIGGEYYHPANWRKRLDFGTGTLGDMGCHILDPIFTSLGLAEPISIRSEGPAPNQWNWALDGKVLYQFAGTTRTASDILPITWYDGAAKPPAEVIASLEGDRVPEAGSVFIGAEGVMLLPNYLRPTLYPREKFKDYRYPDVGEVNHYAQFVNACRGEGQTTTGFGYSGPLTETILLGGIASRFPKTTLSWNAKKMKFNLQEANHFLRREYRKGWSVKGLS